METVLVTGCSSGIVYHVATGLKERGYNVYATARKSEDVTRLIAEGFKCLQLDYADSTSVQDLANELMLLVGTNLYGVFHNGAYGQPGAVEDLTRETLEKQFAANVFGWMELNNRLIVLMRHNNRGRIIFNSSVLGLISLPFRGAYNAISLLPPELRAKGVIAHSSGNHAQAVALAASLLGIKATIVMPRDAPDVKVQATRGYGATVVFSEPTISDRERVTQKLIDQYGYTLIHPYDNDDVIAGAGTVGLELLYQVKDLDVVFCPIGGGGLISGTSIAVKALSPSTKVVGVEPKIVDDAYRSFKTGTLQKNARIDTIADGLRTNLSQRTFNYIRENVDDIVTVSDYEILEAMRFYWERMKIIVEPSGAASLAGALSGQFDIKNKRVGVIISGGNIDLEPFFVHYRERIKS